ncbi:hypothetical protein [Epinotia aporema granulovirus]|uniref:Ac81 n=1 Tax=Epinotia aporema granulovirus TaxID=166056 RepID=K4ER69_9BBAC|nr:hypothetical protein [Epinotia aporema granulovirus]AER41524.1 hypothetical protein [Epinotia aporema granulovirus]
MSSQDGLVNNKRVKYDSQLLLKYIFDFKTKDVSDTPNIIQICRVKVRKTCGTVLAHYYAKVYLANGFMFEFHPGSQPKTFQSVDETKHYVLYKTLILCEECCRKELDGYVEGENRFNIAFRNCESILCNRSSVQSVIGGVLLIVLLINIVEFSVINLFYIAFLICLLYLINNHLLHDPNIHYCPHYNNKTQ